MKSSRQEIQARRDRLAEWIREKGYQSVNRLAEQFQVSPITIRRDLAALERDRQLTRTHGGALAGESNRFAVFRMRVDRNREMKCEIARRAVALLEPGISIYMDAGTTVYAVAQALKFSGLEGLKILTSSIPVAELLLDTAGIEVYLTGGHVVKAHSFLVGELSEVSIAQWDFDMAVMGAEAINETGLWNSSEALVRQQRSVIRRADRVMYCMDPSKSDQQGNVFVCRWDPRFLLVSGA